MLTAARTRGDTTIKKLSPEATAAGLSVEKWVYGYCYARSGNAHNPTPRVSWLVKNAAGKTLSINYKRADALEIAEAIAREEA